MKKKSNSKVWIIVTVFFSILIIGGIVGYGYITRDNKDDDLQKPVVTKLVTEEKKEIKPVASVEKDAAIVPGGTFILEKDINWIIDLDGDSQNEVVCYKEEDVSNVRYLCIYVNNQLILRKPEELYEDEMSTDEGEDEYNSYDVEVKDICSNDNIYEIFIYHNMIDENTEFNIGTVDAYVWENGTLSNIDIIDGEYNCDNTPGLTKICKQLYNICEACYLRPYQYNPETREFKEVETNIFEMSKTIKFIENEDGSFPLYEDLKVYKNIEDNEPSILMKAQDVRFTKVYLDDSKITDDAYSADELWYFVEAKDSTAGWIHVKADLTEEQYEENVKLNFDAGDSGCSVNGELSAKYFKFTSAG